LQVNESSAARLINYFCSREELLLLRQHSSTMGHAATEAALRAMEEENRRLRRELELLGEEREREGQGQGMAARRARVKEIMERITRKVTPYTIHPIHYTHTILIPRKVEEQCVRRGLLAWKGAAMIVEAGGDQSLRVRELEEEVDRLRHEADDLRAARLDTSAVDRLKEQLAAVQAALVEEKEAGEEGRREAAKELAEERARAAAWQERCEEERARGEQQERERAGSIMRGCLNSICHRHTVQAVRQWAKVASAHQRAGLLMKRCLDRIASRHVGRAWVEWAGLLAARRNKVAARMVACLNLICNRKTVHAMLQWVRLVAAGKRAGLVMQRCLGRIEEGIVTLPLARAVCQWAGATEWEECSRRYQAEIEEWRGQVQQMHTTHTIHTIHTTHTIHTIHYNHTIRILYSHCTHSLYAFTMPCRCSACRMMRRRWRGARRAR
jgi:hypothetical protein